MVIGILEFSKRRDHVVGSVYKIFSTVKNWNKDEVINTFCATLLNITISFALIRSLL